MSFVKKNFVIILAFTLPVLLIIVVAISVYIPPLFLSTDYDFVYAVCDNQSNYYRYNCDVYLSSLYKVENNKLIVQDVNPNQDSNKDGTPDIDENYVTRLFLHNTKMNEGREITLSEVQNMNLNELITSPDGISVESVYNRGTSFFIIFDGSSRYGYYLTKGNRKSKLNLVNEDNQYYYRDNFKFIGWVDPKK